MAAPDLSRSGTSRLKSRLQAKLPAPHFLFILLLTVAALAQESSGIMTPEVRRVGNRLACLCRSCKNTVGDCAMLHCEYCAPKRIKIAAMLAQGKSDQDVVDAIVGEEGRQALSVPPTQGFSLFAWTMPYIAVVLGLIAIWVFFRRFSARRHPMPAVDPAVLDHYHDRIEKDLAKLE
jgi:cytochrome c-type biogenesis protein CcmH